MAEENSNLQPIIINGRELKMFVVIPIHTLKRCKKKCGHEDVDNLVQELLDYEMSIYNFNETLNSLIESKSIIFNAIRNRECLSLPKENEHNEEDYINEQSNNFKNNFLDDFNNFKGTFFHEVKIKRIFLSYARQHMKMQITKNRLLLPYFIMVIFSLKNSYKKKKKLLIL